ncbi:MAG: 1-deoxy-D-xylulose-5-phosphate synthase [Clostridia bacterium]|nr:1-deoxy-D-xylulose-5-phosphate synthase [Clostridia bacterium]
MEYQFLGKKSTSEELKKLSYKDCALLCKEIREELVSRVTENGGHLASNLGVVELTLALHRTFSLPKDRVIFDVSHQSYVHKMLSGRLDRFDTLRKPGGLSGFQKREESPYDPFGGGHASTSLSCALGFAEADRILKRDNYTVAVLGDGAFTGGMIHEALNNCDRDLRLIIILNENEMSISPNTGHFASYISKIRSSSGYFGIKRNTKKLFSHCRWGRNLTHFVSRQKAKIKQMTFLDNYFEQMDIKYLGPIDGHDQKKLELLLSEAKLHEGCSLIHVKTTKGKGYAPAEEHPDVYHGIPPKGTVKVETFSEHFGNALCALAKEDPRICAITAAMADGTGLSTFARQFPDRFFDVGIAEEHALTFAAGLSAAEVKPVFAVYSTFLQRSYDQLIHDAALQKLPLVLAVDRAGFAKADGPTHHGLFDVSMALSLPDSRIYAPLDFSALDLLLEKALSDKAISFIRYRSGGECVCAKDLPYIYKEEFVRASLPEGPLDGVILTYGPLCEEALRAQRLAKEKGKTVGVLVLESLRPTKALTEKIASLTDGCPTVLFAEEGVRNGGAAEAFASSLAPVLAPKGKKLHVAAIEDPFLLQDGIEDIRSIHGISAEKLLLRLSL